MSITRRIFFRNAAAAGAGATTIAAPVVVEASKPTSAEDRAVQAWSEFCAALEELMPADCRIQVFGSHVAGRQHPSIRVEAMRTQIERVHPKVRMPVKRIVQTAYVHRDGWRFDPY